MTDSISRGFIRRAQNDVNAQQQELDQRTEEVRKSLLDFNKRFTKSISSAKKVIESLDDSKARRDLESAVKKAESFASVQKRLQKQGAQISSKEADGLVKAAENLNKIITTNDKVVTKIKEQGEKVENLDIETPLKKATEKLGENAKDFFISNAQKISQSGLTEDSSQFAVRAVSPELAFITEALGFSLGDTLSSIGGFFGQDTADDTDDVDTLLDGVESRITAGNESLESTTEKEEKKTRDAIVKAQKVATAEVVEAIENQVIAEQKMNDDLIQADNFRNEENLAVQADQHAENLEALDDIEDNKTRFGGIFGKFFGKGSLLGGLLSKLLVPVTILGKLLGKAASGIGKVGAAGIGTSPVVAGTPSKPGGFLAKTGQAAKSVGSGILKAGKFLGKGLGAGLLLSIATIGLEDIDFEPINKAIMGTLESLKISLQTSYENAKQTVSEFFTKAKDAVSSGLEEATLISEDLSQHFEEKVKSGFDFLRTKVGETLDTLDFWEGNPPTLEDTFRPVTNFFKDIGTKLGDSISEFITSMELSVGDLLSKTSFTDDIRQSLGIRTTDDFMKSKAKEDQIIRRSASLGLTPEAYLDWKSGKITVEQAKSISSSALGVKSSTSTNNITVDPNIQTSNQLESNIAQIETAEAINASAERQEQVQQRQSKETQKILAQSEENQRRSSSSYRGKRSLDNSPVVSDDIGLVMVLGGGL